MKKILLFFILFITSLSGYSQRLNFVYHSEIGLFNINHSKHDSYRDVYASKDMIIKKNQINLSLFFDGMLGASYEYDRFIFGANLGYFSREFIINYLTLYNDGEESESSMDINVSGICTHIYANYVFLIKPPATRYFISVGYYPSFILKKPDTDISNNENIFDLSNNEIYKKRLSDEYLSGNKSPIGISLGLYTKPKNLICLALGVSITSINNNTYFDAYSVSFFLGLTVPILKKKKYIDVFINE